jgi:hypothetical protein
MTKEKNSFMRITFGRVIPAILVGYFVYYTVFYTIAIRSQLKEWNAIESTDTIKYTEGEWQLIRTKTFLDARLAMSESDSIGMTINLRDSLVQLEMKGVVLRQVKFDKLEISRFYKGLTPVAYASHFSTPFTIGEIEGSIVKEPITVRKVPKDTIEAAQNEVKVDTTGVEFVEWHFTLDSALMVSFVQSDQLEGPVTLATLKYRFRRYLKTLVETNHSTLRFRKPQIYPEMTIFIPANEAKSFYRALPPRGQVVLKL